MKRLRELRLFILEKVLLDTLLQPFSTSTGLISKVETIFFNSSIAHKPFDLPHCTPDAYPLLLTYSVCHSQIFPSL